MKFSYDGLKKLIFEEETVVAFLSVGIHHKPNISKMFNNGDSKTSVAWEFKSQLLDKTFKVIY